jgi:enterochelin esterase family protein
VLLQELHRAPRGVDQEVLFAGTELDNAAGKRGLNLLWFSTGKEDFLIDTTRSTVELLKKHGFKPVFIESQGAHTWLNWRDYLSVFAPQLFQGQRSPTSSGQ